MNDLQELQGLQGIASTNSEGQRGWKAVYTIVERAGSDKKHWIRIGTAFVNRDQSLNVRLDATPTNGQLHIRDAEPYDPSAPRRRPPTDSLAGFGGVA